jgi:alpha-L-fucosidase
VTRKTTVKYFVRYVAIAMSSLSFLFVGSFTSSSGSQVQSSSPTPLRVTISLPSGAKPIPKGPFAPTWESIRRNYRVPQWFVDAKFGIFMHWGLYAVPAKQSEWYARHMYSNPEIAKWHAEKFGMQNEFGYKDFIPLFKAEKFDPDQWATLFRKAGARYVVPTAEHHDGFAMYDSALTKWDAADMGPKRDLIGDLAKAVRKQGMKFGVSNHRMEHWDFMYPQLKMETDLFDPRYADFYGPPQPPPPRPARPGGGEVIEDPSSAPQSEEFLEEWLARCQELVDKYQPDMMWFDNGVNSRSLDPVKLRFAAYYYNRASRWHKEVSISTKSDAFLAGSIRDFERQHRAPKMLTDYYWQVDDPVLFRFGYTEGSPITNADAVVKKLVENVSKNGALLLNISPRADGTIPDNQQQLLLAVGRWLDVNGEAIYSTRPWTSFGEGVLDLPKDQSYTGQDIRFTTKSGTLYAILMAWPGERAVITSLASGKPSRGKIKSVRLLGHKGALSFSQDEMGLRVTMPPAQVGEYAFVLRIN